MRLREAGGVKVTVGLDHEPGEELRLKWQESWDDLFTDRKAWEQTGAAAG